MSKEIEIQDLPTVATNDIPFESLVPVGIRENNREKYRLFKITLKQLEIRLFHIQVETIFNAFEKDPNLTNIIFELRNNLIVINYDETDLNQLTAIVTGDILPLLDKITEAITNLDTGELYNLHDEITRINQALIDLQDLLQDQITNMQIENQEFMANIQSQLDNFIENFSSYNVGIFTAPALLNPSLPINNTNNFAQNFESSYNFTILEFKNKFIVYIWIANAEAAEKSSQINIFNCQTIFDSLGANKDSSVMEIQFIIKCYEPLIFWAQAFYAKQIVLFRGETTTTNQRLLIIDNMFFSGNMVAYSNYSFSIYVNSAGVIGTSYDYGNIASVVDVQNAINSVASVIAPNIHYSVSMENSTLVFVTQNEMYPSSLLLMPEEITNITKIVIFAGNEVFAGLQKYIWELNLPFYRMKEKTITVSLMYNGIESSIVKTLDIQNNQMDNQVILILESVNSTHDNLRIEYKSSSVHLETKLDFEIDYTKFNSIEDLTLKIPEHSKNLILNLKLKDPFLLAEGLLPEYFKPDILPQQSEDLIAVFLDSLVGSLDMLESMEINLILGDTKGFFRYFAWNFTPEAAPERFSQNESSIRNNIVAMGANDEIAGMTNNMAGTSTYNFEMQEKNNQKFMRLISAANTDAYFFEKQRQLQFQTLMQSVSNKLLNTTLYFNNAIVSNRSGLNLNFFNPNPEYNGSNVSVYVPIRETEYVFNGYLRLDILNDVYQNSQGLTPYYFIKSEFHFVDYYSVNGQINKRISNEATYDFDAKQSRTMLIFVNNLTDVPRDFYFNLDLVFGLRFAEDCDFWIRVINYDVPVKLTDSNPSIQVAPNFSYGVEYASTNTNFVFEQKFTIQRTVTAAPLDVKKEKFTFAVRLSSDFAKCEEIPYNPPIFVTSQQLQNYPTLAEVQALVAQIITGGTLDLTEYAKTVDLVELENKINNYVLASFATKNELATTNTNVNTNATNIATVTNNLATNYYTKTDSDTKFALQTSLAETDNTVEALDISVTSIKEQFLRKIEANELYSTKTAVTQLAAKSQSSIPQVLAITEIPTYKSIPSSAKKITVTRSIQQVRDHYIGFLDKDYTVDDPVILHLQIIITKDDLGVVQNFPLQGNVEYKALGSVINGEYFVDFRHNNAKVGTFRPDLKGTIVSSLKYPFVTGENDETFILCGTRHVTSTLEKTWMHPTRMGLTDKLDGTNTWSVNPIGVDKNKNYGYILEQAIGANNIPKAMHSALATGQIPVNICFALKTHRPIYIEITNPDAPTVNVTCTFMVEKENQFAWVQPNTSYNTSTCLIFTNNISKPIPKELQYIFDEFKAEGYRYINSDSRATIDNIVLPTLNGILAHTASVFPDFYASEREPLKCKNGYFDHPSNLYYYIIMRYGDAIYQTVKADYLNYAVKYDGRTIDIKTGIKYRASKSNAATYSLYLSNACKSHELITENFTQNLYANAWKYIIRKDFSAFTRLVGWSENHCLVDANSKGILAIKPNSYILYLEPNSMLPSILLNDVKFFDAQFSIGTSPLPDADPSYGGNRKIYNLAKTFDSISQTKWIAIHMLYRPINDSSGYRLLNARPTIGRIVPEVEYNTGWSFAFKRNTDLSAVYQGMYLETWFEALDALPADTNFINN